MVQNTASKTIAAAFKHQLVISPPSDEQSGAGSRSKLGVGCGKGGGLG